jgi:fibronectin-binding autotransporter adhesin
MNTTITNKIFRARHSAGRAAWTFTLALALLAPAAFAANTDTWIVGSGNNFSTLANWTYSPGPGPVITGDSLVFGGAGSTTPNNDETGFTFNGITFNWGASQAYTIGGNAFTLNGTIIDNYTNGASVETINNNITLASGGGIASVGTNSSLTLGGIISGSGNFTKSGGTGSTLTLSGVNTFSGVLTFNAGTVVFTTPPSVSGGNLGNPSGITFGGSSTTTLVTTSGAGSVTISTPTITANASSTALFKNGAAAGTTLEISAKITGAGNCKQNTPTTTGAIVRFSNDTSDYTGAFSMAASVVEFTSVANGGSPSALGAGSTAYTIGNGSSAGTFRYVGAGTTSTTRAINCTATTGALTLDSSGGGAVQFLGSGNLKSGSGAESLTLRGTSTGANTLAQVISDVGGVTTLTKSDAGTWILSGANTYSGLTTVGAGTLQLNGSGTLGSGGLTLNGGTLDLGGSSQTVGAVTISGASTIQNGTLSASSYSATLSSGTATASANLAGSSAAMSLSAAGTLMLLGANTYNGGTIIGSAGMLLVTNDTGLGNSSGGITFSASGALAATNNAAPVTNTVTIGASRTITVNSGITANFQTPDTNSLTIAAKITGLGNVTKKSSGFALGTVRFSNDTSDYTGDFLTGYGNTEFTSVADRGTASSLGAGAAGTGGQITLGNASSSGTLRYVGSGNSSTHRPLNWTATTATGYTLDASGSGTVQFLATGNMRSGSGGATGLILRGSNTGANTLAQVINDQGGVTSLTKNDAGTWVLTGANTFSGPVSLVGGVLQLNATETPGTSGPLGTNGTISFSGGTLRFTSADAADYSSRFSTAASQPCKIDCNGQSVTFATPMTSSGGTLAVSSSTPGGSLTLSAANTYSGSTTVSSGTLLVNGSIDGGGVTVTGGTLGGSGAINSAVSVQSSGTLQPGSGGVNIATLTVNSSLTLAGKTVILLNRTNAQIASLVTGISSLTNGGTLTVTNVGDALQAGDSFTLFSAASYAGSFAATNLPALSTGLVWDTSKLAQNGSITIGEAPSITTAPASQVVECTGNATFTVAATGSPTLAYQWSVNGSAVSGATSTSFTTNNVHGAGSVYTISATVSSAFGSVTSNATLTVQDTLAPGIALNGSNPMTVECHSTFTDPGAMALDACVGPVSAVTSGSVNANSPGSYTITYTANDGNGYIATATRTVHVVDTTAPVVSWSFTNLTLSANGSCQALMPDVTGTNYILAADACSSVLAITQTPTNNAVLALGTNEVVLAVADGNGNTAYSTNTVVVADQTAPMITLLGASPLTNECHSAFADPGATTLDNCSGVVSLSTNSTVNANAVGVYTIEYVASDTAGNTATNSRLVYVVDTVAPVVTLIGANPLMVECHGVFSDPGASAEDACAGSLSVSVSGAVNANAPGTYTLTYSATDHSGNLGSGTRTVIVQDTTPPQITFVFTNLVLSAASSNCQVSLPDLTGTNYIIATDSCSSVTVTQTPLIGTVLSYGTTNEVVLTALDASGNAAYSTNTVVVAEGAAPVITTQPQSRTNLVGTDAIFTEQATSCGPVSYQWYLNTNALAEQTNATLTVTNVQLADAGSYLVTLANAAGSSTSAVAVLTVNRPPVASNTNAGVTENQALVLDNAKLLALCSDPDGDPLSIISAGPLSTNGGSVTLTSSNVTYLPLTNFVGADRFDFTVSDGRGGSATGSVLVAVTSASAPSLNIVSGPNILPNGHFHVGFAGIPGFSYTIQYSANVDGPWTTLTNLMAGTNGLFDFEDPTEPAPPTRFYRTTYP